MPIKADLRGAQLEATKVAGMKLRIARAFVEAKITRSIQVLEWLAERYDVSRDVLLVKREAMKLRHVRTVEAIRSVEGRVALKYWTAYGKVLPESLDFQGRMTSSHQNNATDPVNAALNYGYGFLEGECRRAINAVGLEPSVGFLHDFSDYQTKQSMVYDLEEPFRWLVDLTVIQAFESGSLDVPHFYFTGDDYRYRFDVEAKTRFINLLREQFNSDVNYKGHHLKWDTVIEQKVTELSRFLRGRSRQLDFTDPRPILARLDSSNLRNKILSLTQQEATKAGIGKSTLHYLRQNAHSPKCFKTYKSVLSRLEALA
jgi:CRISPR-associated protein Cas1